MPEAKKPFVVDINGKLYGIQRCFKYNRNGRDIYVPLSCGEIVSVFSDEDGRLIEEVSKEDKSLFEKLLEAILKDSERRRQNAKKKEETR